MVLFSSPCPQPLPCPQLGPGSQRECAAGARSAPQRCLSASGSLWLGWLGFWLGWLSASASGFFWLWFLLDLAWIWLDFVDLAWLWLDLAGVGLDLAGF